MKHSLFRKLLDLLFVILIVNAVWRLGPPFYQYFEFRSQVAEAARWSTAGSTTELKQAVLDTARRMNVPLREEDVSVTRRRERLLVNVRYVQPLEVVPLYYYDYEFSIAVDTLLARPSSASDIR